VAGVLPSGGTSFNANFRQVVYRNASGFLDFYYQLGITGPAPSSHVNWLITQGFAGFTTNVAYDTALNLVPAPSSAVYQAPTGVQRTSNGSQITFKWAAPSTPMTGQDIYSVLIGTNDTDYTSGTTQLMNSGIANIATFAPGPEPASIVLFGTVIAGVAFLARRRQRRLVKQ
jgi:hypothetical protein